MAKETKKFYWLKLQKDFFKRHDVKIIENMPNGKDYIIFYLKLLTESISHGGMLRFNDTLPYDDHMIATITDTNIDVVRSAIKLFKSLHLMEVWDDLTLYMTETQKMLGYETEWAKQKREYRSKNTLTDNSRTKKDNVRQEIELEIELEIDKKNTKKDNLPLTDKSKTFIKPTLEEVTAYCNERNNGVDPNKFINFYESKGWMVGKNKMKDWKASVRTWEEPKAKKQKLENIGSVTEL